MSKEEALFFVLADHHTRWLELNIIVPTPEEMKAMAEEYRRENDGR